MTYHGEPLSVGDNQGGGASPQMAATTTTTAATPSDPAHAETPILLPTEAPRAVVVNGLPLAGPEVTEENLISRFSHYGSIERMVIQKDTTNQSAFILFHSEEAASNATEFSGEIMGEHVTLSRFVPSSPRSQKLITAVSEGTAVVLAGSMVVGMKGLEVLKRIDDKTGVTRSLKSIDESTKLTANIKKGASKVLTTLHDADEKLGVTTTVKDGCKLALQNRYVAVGAERTGQVLGDVIAWTRSTVAMAKSMVDEELAHSSPTTITAAGGALDDSQVSTSTTGDIVIPKVDDPSTTAAV